ncbi:MAG: ribosome silencing factor [Gemmataceae bacterium]|nr:ribosome silencing factor [Gemmataceae bacterium]
MEIGWKASPSPAWPLSVNRLALVLADPEATPDAGEGTTLLDPAGAGPSGTKRPEGGPLKLATTGQEILSALDRACLSARVASDNKARDVAVLDMRGITPLYDFFVLATGSSRRLVHTITEEIDSALQEQGDHRYSVEGYEASTWVVQDYGDVVVHVFNPQTREYYALEDLYADAPRIDWEQHLLGID